MPSYQPDIDLTRPETYRARIGYNADILTAALRGVAADIKALPDRYTHRVVDRERGYAGIGADIELYPVAGTDEEGADAAAAVVETWLAPDRIEHTVAGEDPLERVVEDVLAQEDALHWSRRPETVL